MEAPDLSARDVAEQEAIEARKAELADRPPQVEILESQLAQARQELMLSIQRENAAAGSALQAKEAAEDAKQQSQRASGKMEALEWALQIAREYRPVE